MIEPVVYDGTMDSVTDIIQTIFHVEREHDSYVNSFSYSDTTCVFVVNDLEIAIGDRVGFEGPTAVILPAVKE